ncbi:AAA family ATPase [Histomonas meleagridis]|uniref:AAA family ATPase n=1 Tax=Histomonas meleagridis TaxID=135588 RepID=UPI00355A671A|nr:AAA family ATPase [Histomonas meleagridis]KAH0800785.1 AAA family ATPase [Histomonas meleagridis]
MNRFPPKPATPDNWHKITHTTTQQNSIGEEIQKAPAKSTIILPPGDYYENLEIKKDIHLVGEGSTIINALPSGDPITIDGANVFLEHLTIQTGNSQCASPINLIGGTIIVEKCNIISSFMPAITIHKEGRLYFNECTITSNMMPIIYTNNSIKIEFQKCTISAPKSIGIVATNFSQVRFVESKITGCGDSGIVVMNSASLSVDKSVIENNAGDAIELNTDSLSNTILNTTITNHESGSAINCSGKGRLRIEKCKISKCVSGFFGSNEFNINSTQCEILDMISSALIYAIKKSVINLNGDILSGKCLSGIISDHQSSVKCEQVTLSDIETTGAFVSGNSLLKMNKCKVENIGQIAIESTEASTIEITDTDIEKVGKIGKYELYQGIASIVCNILFWMYNFSHQRRVSFMQNLGDLILFVFLPSVFVLVCLSRQSALLDITEGSSIPLDRWISKLGNFIKTVTAPKYN